MGAAALAMRVHCSSVMSKERAAHRKARCVDFRAGWSRSRRTVVRQVMFGDQVFASARRHFRLGRLASAASPELFLAVALHQQAKFLAALVEATIAQVAIVQPLASFPPEVAAATPLMFEGDAALAIFGAKVERDGLVSRLISTAQQSSLG